MYTINNNSEYELIIKNSRFICLLYKINSPIDVDKYLELAKTKYPQATHYCYAFIINDIKKSSDDKEPKGTAGIPMLKVLETMNIVNTLAITVRYFGGILLGASGLTRAYSKCLTNAIKENKLLTLIDGYTIDITFDYNQISLINYLIKDIKINNKIFDTTVSYNIDIKSSDLSILINNNINYKINKKIQLEE